MADIGYLTVTEADTYFSTRFGASLWSGLVEATHKEPLLQTGYNRLDDVYNLPAAPTGTTLTRLQRAQCEMAWYMYIHMEDEDRRMGLRAQGVAGAGVVKETYGTRLSKEPFLVPIPAHVEALMKDYTKNKAGYMVEIGRDEDEDIDVDVT